MRWLLDALFQIEFTSITGSALLKAAVPMSLALTASWFIATL